jgi:hypothetical protein
MALDRRWRLVAQLGDVNPLDYGGYFVLEDTRGEWCPTAELLEVVDDGDRSVRWEVYTIGLDKCTYTKPRAASLPGCPPGTSDVGVLSDNPFHPDHPAWFAESLEEVARFGGVDVDELRRWFCSDDLSERAEAYRCVGMYHGFDNFDGQPLILSLSDVKARYRRFLK